MAGTRRSGNPNIIEDTKGKKTGPKTTWGKLRVSMNPSKTLDQSKELDKAIEETGIKFDKVSSAIALKQMFLAWLKSKTGKELTEIERLDEVISLLESDVATRAMSKLEEGIPLSDKDIKTMKLLKEALEASHKMKYGTKQFNVNADYQDIRALMFGDKSDNT
ncbi:MAG TPA: hypothetical protein ENI23_02345 [bacterium]|nr:hypothetical protein [bacterium]